MRSLFAALTLAAGILVFSVAALPSSASSQSGWVRLRSDTGFSFRYPSAWTRVKRCGIVLTTAPMAPICRYRPHQPARGQTKHRLNPSGILVHWEEVSPAGVTAGPWWWYPVFKNSPTIHLGGARARSATLRPSKFAELPIDGCRRVGADLALVTQVRRPHGGNTSYLMTACLRGPHLAANRRAVRRMLSSIGFWY